VSCPVDEGCKTKGLHTFLQSAPLIRKYFCSKNLEANCLGIDCDLYSTRAVHKQKAQWESCHICIERDRFRFDPLRCNFQSSYRLNLFVRIVSTTLINLNWLTVLFTSTLITGELRPCALTENGVCLLS